MMELLRQWLVGITCAAMIVALADSLTPSGTVRKIGRMAGGLLLLVAVVQPVLHVDFSVLAASAVQIELDKAEALGVPCKRVTVTCTVGEDGVPYPSAVSITGAPGGEERRLLARIIEADLAIPEECQTYESGDGAS